MSAFDLRQLRYFVAVAEERHFSRAAARVGVAQPALSQQIARLERRLGAQLLVRTTRRVDLTGAGVILLHHARNVLLSADRAESDLVRCLQGELGEVRIAFVSSAALSILPRLTQAIRAEVPELTMTLLERTTDIQLELLGSGEIDLGIVREVRALPGLVFEVISRERLYLAVHESHPLSTRTTVALGELAGEGFVVFPRQQVPRLYDHLSRLCNKAGFELSVAQEATQFSTILGLVAGRAGIAIVPSPLRAVRLSGLRFLEIEDEQAVSVVSLAHNPRRPSSGAMERVRERTLDLATLGDDPALL